MNIRIIAIGKVKEKFTREWIQEFLKRLRKIEIIEIKESNRNKESEQIIPKLKKEHYTILLDIQGKRVTSEDFAKLLHKKLLEKNVTFIIGGPEGVTTQLKETVNLRLSLSELTFTHQIARLLLLEQIYRAEQIRKGTKYHK
jgi:23S rRNA (pseudouridine1915-N3)-methyltransferase